MTAAASAGQLIDKVHDISGRLSEAVCTAPPARRDPPSRAWMRADICSSMPPPLRDLERDRAWRLKLPHLRNVFASGRESPSGLSQLDYSESWSITNILHHTFNPSSNASDFVQKILTIEAPCRTRLVIIEDICPSLVEAFSQFQEFEEEFFEEHLINSGWTSEDAYGSPMGEVCCCQHWA